MQIIARRTLWEFWEAYPPAEAPLRTWYALVVAAEWSGPSDVRAMFGSADFVGGSRVIFNISGNKYRLIVHVAYAYKQVLVKFIGTMPITTRSMRRPCDGHSSDPYRG